MYRGSGSQAGGATVVTVVVEQGRSEEVMGEEGEEVEVGESVLQEGGSHDSDLSCGSTSSDNSSKELINRKAS